MTVELSSEVYARAEKILASDRDALILRAKIKPQWREDGKSFWYLVATELGSEFIWADPDSSVRRPAFDQERLASSLAAALGEPVEAYALPFRTITIDNDEVQFDLPGGRWTCHLDDYSCELHEDYVPVSPLEVPSPDGKWAVFRREHNLWHKSLTGGEEVQLTNDGSEDFSYGATPDNGSYRHLLGKFGLPELPPAVLWSPDSTRILSHRTNQHDLPLMSLVESSPVDGGRPKLHQYRYALPGEPHLPKGEWVVIDVASREAVFADQEPFLIPYLSPIMLKTAWWDADGELVYYLNQPRDVRSLALDRFDPASGKVERVIEEFAETRVEPSQVLGQPPLVRVLSSTNEVLWYSQQDGWGHLYLHHQGDRSSVTQVTTGAFAVQQILHVDEDERDAYLVVSGLVEEDLYIRSFVKVGLDSGVLTRLTDDALDHVMVAPEHGRWFVDSASTVNTPPVTTVRGQDGSVLLALEVADISRLEAVDWTAPERIRTLAEDGTTPIFGVLYKPFDFDPTKKYPVIDHPYPGPQINRVQPSFDQSPHFSYEAEATAALGFVVVAIDGRGTPGRDKAFHDYSWTNMASAGLEDHVSAIEQLAQTRPWMDLDHVGIFGRSGGGFATVRALASYPDFYKVGVAEAGNHDNRYYHAVWAETYDGPPNDEVYAKTANTSVVESIRGHLLLVHGEMDDNVTPQLTLRLVDRLIAADKDFDLLIVPGAEHGFVGYEHYTTRRRWDYFVRHLMHAEPPAGYRLTPTPITADTLEQLFS